MDVVQRSRPFLNGPQEPFMVIFQEVIENLQAAIEGHGDGNRKTIRNPTNQRKERRKKLNIKAEHGKIRRSSRDKPSTDKSSS